MENLGEARECPNRGSQELGKGRHSGYAVMTPVNKFSSSGIEYIVCTDCGYILEGYVTKPSKFKSRN
ncbi:transcription initiation factor TFIIIB [Ornithinibacillus bavariensis]|uniref:transcription initiation factor TFIIIB n=1 Tax=Ornithinibacillus bavariensis TaxID=545502 RepID=UPI000EDBAC78|nr:transcription initiation factor TFIIIB [Ornithinibacillus sp.]